MDPMARKRLLILHVSAAPYYHTVEDVRRWHVEENGWNDIGYHFIINLEGKLVPCRPIDQKGAHTYGHNQEIGLCLLGMKGGAQNQLKTLERFIINNRELISGVKQHSDFDPKKPHCAGFTASQMNYLNNLVT